MPYGRKTMKRRSGTHRVHHKRKRVGAVGPKGQLLTVLLSAAAGGLIGKFISDKLVTFLPSTLSTTTQSYIKAGLLSAGGMFLAFKMTNPMVKGVGVGLFVEGVHSLGTALGLVSGMGNNPASLVFPRGPKVGDYYNVKRINGGTDFPRPQTVGGHRRPAVTVMGGI